MASVEKAEGFRIVRYHGEAGPPGRVANLRCNDCEFAVDVELLRGNRDARETSGFDYIRAHIARHALCKRKDCGKPLWLHRRFKGDGRAGMGGPIRHKFVEQANA